MLSAPEDPIFILAVDDREQNLIALEAAFEGSGYNLVTALSGEDALEKITELDVAAVLLDVQMPGIDGFETARLIRRRERNKNTPILFLTAIHRTEQYERKGYISGAVDFLFKPLDTQILIAKVAIFVELYRAKLQNQRLMQIAHERALKEQELEFLKRAVEVRDEFLTIASHELSTPMTPLSLQMQFFLKMIREDRLKTIEPERLERMLETAFGQVERLSRIIKDLLDVSRVTTGKLRLERGEVSLAEVTSAVLGAYTEEIRQLGCEVKLNVSAEPTGNWDRIRLEQLIVNLLSNALKYGLGKPVRVSVGQDGENAVLRVQDHGIGIAPADRERIFERYERAVSPKNFGGLGLGLFISHEIVKLHGGSIDVQSGVGEGSVFTVRIPLAGPPCQ